SSIHTQPPTTTLFPTRRSSDLHYYPLRQIRDRRNANYTGGNKRQRRRYRRGNYIAFIPKGCGEHGRTEGDDQSAQCYEEPRPCLDRKSTRLNSSHDQISYAVFC